MKLPTETWELRARNRFSRICLTLSLCGGALSLAAGCQVLGVAADKIGGDAPVPAKYTTPKGEPLLVLVENYRNPDVVEIPAEMLARRIGDELRHHKAALIVDPNSLQDLRTRKPQEFAHLSIPALGNALGAKKILYGNLLHFSIEPALGSDMVKGHAQIQVRIVDVASGATVWPTDQGDGQTLSVDTSYVQLADGVTETNVRNRLVDELGSNVSRLFYAVRPSEMEESSEMKEPG